MFQTEVTHFLDLELSSNVVQVQDAHDKLHRSLRFKVDMVQNIVLYFSDLEMSPNLSQVHNALDKFENNLHFTTFGPLLAKGARCFKLSGINIFQVNDK